MSDFFLNLGASISTFTGGLASGYIVTWILQKFSKTVLTILGIVIGVIVMFMWWLQYMGFAQIYWSKFFNWLITMLINFIQWLSLHVLTLESSTGIFTTGFLTGSLVRILQKATISSIKIISNIDRKRKRKYWELID